METTPQPDRGTLALVCRWAWVGYWSVAWVTTALFLGVVHTPEGLLDGSVALVLMSNMVWTFLCWIVEIVVGLLLLNRIVFDHIRPTRFAFAHLLLATVGRYWCFYEWMPIFAGC